MLFLFISLSSEENKTLDESLNSMLPLGNVPCNLKYCTSKHIRITILSDGYKCLTSVKREEKLERKMFCFSMTSVTVPTSALQNLTKAKFADFAVDIS